MYKLLQPSRVIRVKSRGYYHESNDTPRTKNRHTRTRTSLRTVTVCVLNFLNSTIATIYFSLKFSAKPSVKSSEAILTGSWKISQMRRTLEFGPTKIRILDRFHWKFYTRSQARGTLWVQQGTHWTAIPISVFKYMIFSIWWPWPLDIFIQATVMTRSGFDTDKWDNKYYTHV